MFFIIPVCNNLKLLNFTRKIYKIIEISIFIERVKKKDVYP